MPSLGLLVALGLGACTGGSSSGSTATPAPASLVVSPAGGVALSGDFGGPFAPASADYVLRNDGEEALDWSLFTTESWIGSSPASGTLDGGQSVTLTLTFDQVELAGFPAGVFPAVFELRNDTNGVGSTSRQVDLDVRALPVQIRVTPDEDLSIEGPDGGPFTPGKKTYLVANTGTDDAGWSAAPSVPWLSVTPAAGVLRPNEVRQVSVKVDQALAAALSVGSFSAEVEFLDLGAGAVAAQSLGVSLEVKVLGSSTDVLSQHGLTWTFDRDYDVGQYANGSYWVVGPVTVVDIAPPSQASGGRVMSGSVVNPSPRDVGQGYDSAMFGQYKSPGSYQPALNVGLGVSPANPLVLQPGSSLVSSLSLATAGARPQLEGAAILTVVDVPPPDGSFRPPYCGTDKTPRWNVADLDWSKLARLPKIPATPPIARVSKAFERPWIDHIPDWIGRYHHPLQNMPDYGREIADDVGYASLLLNMDFTDEEKEQLLVRFVQLGIDFWGIVLDGGQNNWPAGGGHHSGRKWPILFAGLLLNDPDMSAIGFDPGVAFNEDDQTFYVAETSPGVYNWGFGGYGPQHVGLAEWGNQHAKNKGQDDVTWFGNPYRTCCTANVWWGELLAARVMGAKALWNHDALFDYADRYRLVSETTGQAQWQISWTPFPLAMWDTYRDQY